MTGAMRVFKANVKDTDGMTADDLGLAAARVLEDRAARFRSLAASATTERARVLLAEMAHRAEAAEAEAIETADAD